MSLTASAAPVASAGSDGSGPPRSLSICSDMWKAYLAKSSPSRQSPPGAMPSTSWRFHIAKHMSDAIDRGPPRWKSASGSARRQPLLSRRRRAGSSPETQGESDGPAHGGAPAQHGRELLQHSTCGRGYVRAMLLREWFDHFWRYRSVDWAGAFLDEWCVQRVVRPSHALAHRADEEGRPYVASPSTADLELVSRARRDFRGHRGGLQQQSETDHQKGVRLSLVSMPGNRSVPYTRSATGVRNYPQILLKTRPTPPPQNLWVATQQPERF